MRAVVLQVADAQAEKGQIEGEEEAEEGDGGAEGADEEDGGEDEPAHEVEAEGVEEGGGAVGFEGGGDVEAARGEDYGEGEPETAVGGEGGGAEGVADGHFPGGMVLEGVDFFLFGDEDMEKEKFDPTTRTTCRREAELAHHSRRRWRRRGIFFCRCFIND